MENEYNFPPVNRLSSSRLSQKEFFPYDAFAFEDPNKTDYPKIFIKAPWQLSSALGIEDKSSNYSFLDDDGVDVILATGGASGITIDWASLTSASRGRRFYVIKTDAAAGAITLSGTISGTANPTLASRYDYYAILFDGTSLWRIG